MFLAKSINEKLKRSLSENEMGSISNPKYDQSKNNRHPALLIVHKHIRDNELNSLEILTKTEWENKFTVSRLKSKWKEKLHLDFNANHKKFSDKLISPQAKKSKEFLKDLIDRDILDVKNKRWNSSSNEKERTVTELKKTIFEVSQGLKDFQVVKLKTHKIPEGIDTRRNLIVNGRKWNNSTLFENNEKKNIDKDIEEKAQNNTINYWNMTQSARNSQSLIPISEDRQKIEGLRYYKRYKSPIQYTTELYKTMQEVRNLTSFEREKVAKNIIHNNPGSNNCPEKINSLIEKEMYNSYRAKYDELIGKTKTKAQTIKVDWKDEDISDRIKTLTVWKDVNWIKSLVSQSDKSAESDIIQRKELLKPLVPKASIIIKEEENIKDKIIQNYKQMIKKEMLQKRNKALSIDSSKMHNIMTKSKYPIDREEYDKCISNQSKDIEQYLANSSGSYNDFINDNPSNIMSPNQKYNTKYFLEAYKKVAFKSINNEKKKRQKILKDKSIFYRYAHPGTFREFESRDKILNELNPLLFTLNIENIKAWSCCMNTIKNSKGCSKIVINKYKWNLSNA